MAKEISRSTKLKKGRNASPLWWRRLSLKEQVEYLEEHPRSKLKPSIKRGGKLPDDVNQVIDKQTSDVVADLNSAIDKAEALWPETVKNMPADEVKSLSEQIKKVVDEQPENVLPPTGKKTRQRGNSFFDDMHNNTDFRRAAVGLALAAKLGLLAVGAGTLLAVNPSYVFLLPSIASGLWRALPDGSVGTGMVLYMGHRMLNSMREGLKEVQDDTEKLKQAIVEAEPTTVASQNKATETSSYHYTDVIKALGAIEVTKVQLLAKHLDLQTHPINRLAVSLHVLYRVEEMLPTLHNLYMTCTSHGYLQLKPRLQANIYALKELRSKLKQDIWNLSCIIKPEGIVEFGDQIYATLKSKFPRLMIDRDRTAIFNTLENNSLQIVHVFQFGTKTGKRRGNVTLYVHANSLSYAIERSDSYTPNSLVKATVSQMTRDLKDHIGVIFG